MDPSFVNKMNNLGIKRIPFLFIVDYEMIKPIVIPLEDTIKNDIRFSIEGTANFKKPRNNKVNYTFLKNPLDYSSYKMSFDKVIHNIRYGNSFLTNLTFPTKIETNLSLEQIFYSGEAPFRLLVRDQFVVFSPELFIRIKDRKISSCPMKGTIDASVPDAKRILLNDPKELAEHHTIVDLIRNDLSMVATNVTVERFRYVDEIITRDKRLLQVSSEISGWLPENYHENIGTMLSDLLPAGSICGAPKKKTLEIIKDAESGPRGYYTGVFGIFDGYNLVSAVMIRFVEKKNGELFYRSGGGITTYSGPDKEYKELIDKIYLPIN